MGTVHVTHVVAMAENRVIGHEGGMPWHISSDLKRFRARTIEPAGTPVTVIVDSS